MLRNIFFQVHWFIGVTAGTVLMVVGATGVLIAFEHEILTAINPSVMRVAPREAQLAPDVLLAMVWQQQPDKRILSLALAADPADAARVTFASDAPGRRGENYYVDPYTAEILGKPAGEAFFRTMTQVHRYLAADEIGKQVVGAATLALVFLSLSGLYLRWPANARNWRAWLLFSPSVRGRALWWHIHSILATWVLPLYLLVALTGLYWSYEWYRDALFAVTGAPRPAQQQGQGRGGDAKPDPTVVGAQFHATARAWDVFRVQAGPFESATLRLPGKPGQPVQVTYLEQDPPHMRAMNRMVVDPASGEVVEHERYRDKPAGARLMGSMYALHTGRFFGMPGLVAVVFASLTLVVSGVSGWLLYLERRRRKARRAARRLARA